MQKIYTALKVLGVLLCFTVLTAPVAQAGPGMVRGHITYVWTSPSGGAIRIGLDSPISFPGTCEMNDFLWVVLPAGVEGNRFFSAVMSAYLSGKLVNFWVSTCSTDRPWGGTHPVPDDVYVGGGF